MRWCGGWRRGGYKSKLVDIPAWRLGILKPVLCPHDSHGRKAWSGPCRTNPQPLGLTKLVQGLTLRPIQALITAAEASGHSSSAGQTGSAPPPHRLRRASAHFSITAQGRPRSPSSFRNRTELHTLPPRRNSSRRRRTPGSGSPASTTPRSNASASPSAAAGRTGRANGATPPNASSRSSSPRSGRGHASGRGRRTQTSRRNPTLGRSRRPPLGSTRRPVDSLRCAT